MGKTNEELALELGVTALILDFEESIKRKKKILINKNLHEFYNYLIKNPGKTITETHKYLKISRVTLYDYIDTLSKEGLLKQDKQEKSAGKSVLLYATKKSIEDIFKYIKNQL